MAMHYRLERLIFSISKQTMLDATLLHIPIHQEYTYLHFAYNMLRYSPKVLFWGTSLNPKQSQLHKKIEKRQQMFYSKWHLLNYTGLYQNSVILPVCIEILQWVEMIKTITMNLMLLTDHKQLITFYLQLLLYYFLLLVIMRLSLKQ